MAHGSVSDPAPHPAPHPAPSAPSGREAADAAFDRFKEATPNWSFGATDRWLWRAAWAARDAQMGNVERLVIALSEYGPVPHQAGCSGAFYPNLEKCGADRLNAALTAFWEGHPDE